MADIEKVPEVLYQPEQPYNYEFDNLPLRNILFRQSMINNALTLNTTEIRNARGSAGTVSNRMNQSLNDSGSLKEAALNTALHNIGHHADGSYSGTDYVRMTLAERSKLTDVDSGATDFSVRFEQVGISDTPVLFESGILPFDDSDTVVWRYDSGSIKADTSFPVSTYHRHHYDLDPIDLAAAFTDYKINLTSTPYMEDSLRVNINGVRLSAIEEVYIPASPPDGTYRLISYTPDHAAGEFSLSLAITGDDVIRIDFDILEA